MQNLNFFPGCDTVGQVKSLYRTNNIERAWWYLRAQKGNPEMESLEIVDLDELEG